MAQLILTQPTKTRCVNDIVLEDKITVFTVYKKGEIRRDGSIGFAGSGHVKVTISFSICRLSRTGKKLPLFGWLCGAVAGAVLSFSGAVHKRDLMIDGVGRDWRKTGFLHFTKSWRE